MEKLTHDLRVMEVMAETMDDYLRSDVLFYPTSRSDLPQVTIGGYLMRQHRLLALRELLSPEDQSRFAEAVHAFEEALDEKIVRFERKANQELEARIRQWREYVNELRQGQGAAYYDSAVDTRAMIHALVAQLRVNPYRLDDRYPSQIAAVDRDLSRHWEKGEFVWPSPWQPAYPPGEYWWLYGQPKRRD